MLEPIPKERIVNIEGCARWFGRSVAATRAWFRRGAPAIKEGSKGEPWEIDLLAVAIWKYGGRPVHSGRNGEDQPDFDPDLLPPSDRKAWYEAEFKKRQLQELDGELMRGEVHEREMAEIIKIVVAGLERLPDLLERDAGISGKAVIKCRDIIDDLRNAVYQELVKDLPEDDAEIV